MELPNSVQAKSQISVPSVHGSPRHGKHRAFAYVGENAEYCGQFVEPKPLTVRDKKHFFYTMMGKTLTALLCVLALASCNLKGNNNRTSADGADSVKVLWATFNIRLDTPVDSLNSWQYRKDSVCRYIKDKVIDIFGMQEVKHNQLVDILAGLPDYGYVGVGRDDGKEGGEYSPLFYRKDKFDVLDGNTFWLSQYPDSAGFIGWDGACPRIASWAKFRDKGTGKVFMGVNTHFDHVGVVARREAALLIIDRIKEIVGDKPAVVTGDFNVNDQAEAYRTMTGNEFVLKDAYKMTDDNEGPAYTFHDFGRLPLADREKIDFIFVTPQIKVEKTEIYQNPETKTGHISDHNPHLARLEF